MFCQVESDVSRERQRTIDNDCQGIGCDKNNQKTSVKDDFPVDVDDPFENATCDSDLVLLVEGRRMHVHKSILSVHSPVFNVMLNNPAFAEKNKKEIPLPEKKYYAMLDFLKQLYPVYSVKGVMDKMTMLNVLPLAQEYQVEHVRQRCGQYIECNADFIICHGKMMVLQYLLFCDKYNLTDYNHELTETAASFSLKELERDANYQDLTHATKARIQRDRCLRLEAVLEGLSRINRAISRCKFHKHIKTCNGVLRGKQLCNACLALELHLVERDSMVPCADLSM